MVGWLIYRGRAAELTNFRRHKLLLTVGIGVGALALALTLIAMTMVWVSLIETAKRAIGNVMAVILGRVAFGEAITRRKLIAVLVMASGVVLVLW